MQLIETLTSQGDDARTVLVDGAEFETPSVVEDFTGVRALLLADPDQLLTMGAWLKAIGAGVGYLLCPAPEGEGLWGLGVAEATEYRESRQSHAVSMSGAPWLPISEPNYRSVVLAAVEAREAAGERRGTFVHLHTHTEYSLLDGYSLIPEMIEAVMADGQTALATTDHFNVAAHPELRNRCLKAGIKPIFGIEANLVDDRHRRGRSWTALVSEDGTQEYEVEDGSSVPAGFRLEKRSDANEVLYNYMHVTLLAMNDVGLRNIWSLASLGYSEGFYGRPRIDWELLERFSEGVIATTGCLRGPLAKPLENADEEASRRNVTRMMDIYPGRLYVEIHTNQLEHQKIVNEVALSLAEDYGLPYFAAVDSHYAAPEDKAPHQVWIASSTKKSLGDDAELFAGDQDYHLLTEAEVREALAYLGPEVVDRAVATTVEVADLCNAEMLGDISPPVFSQVSEEHPDPVARDVDRLIEAFLEGWETRIAPKIERGLYTREEAESRAEVEMGLIIKNAFAGYYLVVREYVNWTKERGCLVGPARGSGGASIVAYTIGINELDPVEHDLLLDRFINEGRTELPDFDIDFPASWRERIKAHIRERWGEEYTLSIGTIQRVRVKGAVDALMRSLADTDVPLPDWGEVEQIKDADDQSSQAAAGTKVSWEDFVIEHEALIGELEGKYPEFMALLTSFVGRVRTFGKHPAGIVVRTDAPLTDLPTRSDESKALVSQFDMDALAALGHVKFDVLTLRNLDTLQETIDSIYRDHGNRINPYAWTEEYDDPQVWDEIASAHTMGVFQIETSEGTELTRRYEPRSVGELADVITLVRPGPKRSGLTDIFIERRDGVRDLSFPHPLLEETLGSTQGVPIFQEQVMAITMLLAGYSAVEADAVRKILGKKQVELVEAAGEEFIRRSVEMGVDEKIVVDLWEQLTEFAKYSFGKAHAYAYAVVAYWTAWFKVHYPAHYLCALLSTAASDRRGDFIGEARRRDIAVHGPDVNESGVHFTPQGDRIRFGLNSVPQVGLPTAEHIVANRPYTSVEDFRERAMTKGAPVNHGHLKALAAAGAFDSIFPNRKALDLMLAAESDGSALRCIFKDEEAVGPNGLPCTFDWANEPDPPMVAKGRGKSKVFTPKPPPKRCTVACRNYTPPPPIDAADVIPYTEAEVQAAERSLLGTWVSANPFDRVDPQDLERMHRASEVNDGLIGMEYVCAAVVEEVREKTDVTGGRYAFLTLDVQDGSLSAICFASLYGDYRQYLKVGQLVFLALNKGKRGLQVTDVVPAPASSLKGAES